MIYYQNNPVKVIAVDGELLSIVPLNRPLSPGVWVKSSDLTADEGLVEIFDRAKEIEEWQNKHHAMITQTPLPIKRIKKYRRQKG
ncbi:MAG TPA: hypothetical protein VFC63_00920 [Blastocatellia bacterium]|nr:hypothetical protein [Blastocatellia bacterium]